MKEVDWDSLFPDAVDRERDAVVAYLYHKAEELRSESPVACFYLRRAADGIIGGKHLGT
jgi:hypothetical protein